MQIIRSFAAGNMTPGSANEDLRYQIGLTLNELTETDPTYRIESIQTHAFQHDRSVTMTAIVVFESARNE
jgi:hypothetical protein